MKFRCQQIRESDGAQCRLKAEHVGKVPCKFDEAKPQAPLPESPQLAQSPMNVGETRYAQYLDLRIKAGEIKRYWFEGVTLRLADRTTLRTDFFIQFADGHLEVHDVKGRKGKRDGGSTFWAEEDSKIKIKVAAETFRGVFIFKIVWPEKHGQWSEKTF